MPGAADACLVTHTIHAPRNTPACRLAFASDLHIGPTTPQAVLNRAAKLIREAEPDVLLLGGDYLFLDATQSKLDRLCSWLSATGATKIIAVVGNHDLWGDETHIIRTLQGAGVQILINAGVRLPAPFEYIAIVGLDEPMTGVVDAAAAFAGSESAAVRIVLCHEPDGLLSCEGRDFDLFLCGHTHGGQIATRTRAIVVPPGELHRAFHAGFFIYRDRQVFVSRGIGGAEIPVRINAQPDVLIVDIEASAQG